MTIYTLTVHHAHNYGAMLQAYALQQKLLELGFVTRIIDYDEIKSKLFYPVKKNSLNESVYNLLFNFKILLYYKQYKRAYDRFEKFYDEQFLKTDKYEECTDIKVPESDILLVGSDQIWNLKQGKSRHYFFLDFSNSAIKASYAASMGSFFSLNDSVREEFKRALLDFKQISVREKESGDYIKQLTGCDYQLHIDPVFLLERNKWDFLVEQCPEERRHEKYIFCYELIPSKTLEECVRAITKRTGFKVVSISPDAHSRLRGDIIIRNAGPIEMLKWLRDAEIVISSSYHGIAFSILYEKPFYAITTEHGKGRIDELLENMGLESRIGNGRSDYDITCDFTEARKYICSQKTLAEKYLCSLSYLGRK